jgi:hypothetical protein
MLSLIPLPYRILALVALVGAIFGFGLVKGLEIGQDRLEAFQEAQEAIANKARVAGLNEQIRRQQNATEALNGLEVRLRILDAKYRGVRANTSGGGVPSLSQAAGSLSSCPDGRDAASRLLGEVESRVIEILEQGDRELAKYRELWELQEKNSGANLVQ